MSESPWDERREGGVLRKKDEAGAKSTELNVKGMTGRVHGWLENKRDNVFVTNEEGGLYVFLHSNKTRIKNEHRLHSARQPVSLNTDITSKPSESDWPDLLCLWDLAERGCAAAAATEALAPSSVCWLPSPYIPASGGARWGGVQD